MDFVMVMGILMTIPVVISAMQALWQKETGN
jgi:hypothetical protein